MITHGKAQLASEVHGIGEVEVLLVHAGVTDRRSWGPVIDAFAGRVRAIAYDARGYGETTYEPEDGWSPAADALAVLDAYEVDRAVLIGGSMGGRTCLDLTLEHPERVRALVLIGSAVGGSPEVATEPEVEPLEQALIAASEAEDLEALNRVEAHLWLDGPYVPEGRVPDPVRALFLEMNRRALGATDPGDAHTRPDAWNEVARIAVPTLVVVGEQDLLDIRRNAEHLARTIPGARLVQLPGAAHLPQLEGDPRLLDELRDFLDTL